MILNTRTRTITRRYTIEKIYKSHITDKSSILDIRRFDEFIPNKIWGLFNSLENLLL